MTTLPPQSLEEVERPRIAPERLAQMDRIQRWALVLGIGALVVCIIGAFFDPLNFFRAYLCAYLYILGLAHGSMVILMIYYLTGGAWGFLIRRILEAGLRTMPLLAILFIPIAVGVRPLYVWADPANADVEAIRHKLLYLNVPFFWARAALYFALWLGITYYLSRWSRLQDETGDPRYAEYLVSLSGPGLVIFGITITFAAIDWIMSLQPGFRSTIFGALFATGEILTSQALALLVLAWLLYRPPLDRLISLEALTDLGTLLFSFLIIWAYMGYFQFMLIWIANLRYDVSWYEPRSRDGWQWLAAVIFVLQFVIPFFMLLMRDVKRRPHMIGSVCVLILVMHLVYQYWQVIPSFHDNTLLNNWMVFLTPIALGGPWLWYYLWQLKRYPLLPLHDANRQSAVHFHRLDLEQQERREEVHHG